MILLHVSDIHFRAPGCLNPDIDPERPYRTRMLQDIRSRVAALGPVDAILINGDIAFQGSPEEYKTATTWIDQLVSAADCSVERVFTIPGNHDVDRKIIQHTPAIQATQAAIAHAQPHCREQVLSAHVTTANPDVSILAPLAAYNDFAKPFNCQIYLPTRLYWTQDLDLQDGIVLRVHGLTSTLLSGAAGQDDTRETLYLSPLQTVLDPLDDVVNLVLSHHPPEWFMDHDDAEDAICGRAALHMFGHTHRQRITREAAYVRFSAGAVNPDRNDRGWQPGYNLIVLGVSGSGSLRTLTIDAHLRQWQSNPDLFRPMYTPEGNDVFQHTIRFPAPFRTDRPAPATVRDFTADTTADTTPPIPVANTAIRPSQTGARDMEAAMGDPNTRNLVFRFWNLTSSARRDITRQLDLIDPDELHLPEPERYSRGLIRAHERGKLDELAQEVAKREAQ